MTQSKIEKLPKLSSTEATRIEKVLEEKNAVGNVQSKEHLPLIKCECGSEILLLPDLQAMNRAIRNHSNEHIKKEENTTSNETLSSNISQLLSQRTLMKISELNDS